MPEWVILVDRADRERGTMEKLQAHREGKLHRAFSVFVLNRAGAILLQQRAESKYHSGGLWSNTCCGHPRPGEPVAAAAARRLREEMGLDLALQAVGAFRYQARLGDLIEHEYDHVLVGRSDAAPRPDPLEVAAWRWMPPEELRADLAAHPERYSAWLAQALEVVERQAGARQGTTPAQGGR
jgi:isopentenyl-diphosphate delta-isomerase